MKLQKQEDGQFKYGFKLFNVTQSVVCSRNVSELELHSAKVWHSHIDVISLHDAAEVLVGGKNTMEAVIVDVSYNHLEM